MTKMLSRLALATMLAASLSGCATSVSNIASAAAQLTPQDAAVAALAGYAMYRLSEMPSWSAKIHEGPRGLAVAEIEKRAYSEGGDGSASYVFARASKKWCEERGLGEPNTVSLVEFWEPTMIGAKRRATGEFRCAP